MQKVFLTIPLIVELVMLAVIPATQLAESTCMMLIVAAVVFGTFEALRMIEATVQHAKNPSKDKADIWEHIGKSFVRLGEGGIAVYAVTVTVCVVGFVLSMSTHADIGEATGLTITGSESTLLAVMSLTVLLTEMRVALVPRFGWPIQ